MRLSSVALPATSTAARCVSTVSRLAVIWSARAASAAGDERLECDRVALVELAVLGAGEREEALQQPVGVVEIHAQLGVQLTGLGRHAAGLRDRDVEGGAHHRQRGAQLVRGVGDEPSLRVKRRLQAFQQPVDRVGEQAQLIARTRHREPLVQVRIRDPLGGRGDRPQRR